MGDNQSTLTYMVNLYILAGQGQLESVQNKYEKQPEKFIRQMCKPYHSELRMFPIDVAMHNSAINTGLFLLDKGSVYFSSLHITCILDSTVDADYKLSYDERMNTASFTIRVKTLYNEEYILIHTLNDLRNKLVDRNYIFPPLDIMAQFCKEKVKYALTHLESITPRLNQPYGYGQKEIDYHTRMLHLMQDVSSILEEYIN